MKNMRQFDAVVAATERFGIFMAPGVRVTVTPLWMKRAENASERQIQPGNCKRTSHGSRLRWPRYMRRDFCNTNWQVGVVQTDKHKACG